MQDRSYRAGVWVRLAVWTVVALAWQAGPLLAKDKGLVPIGVTGIEVDIEKGKALKVGATQPGSPADGKFKPGDILAGVNGTKLDEQRDDQLKVLGAALTGAESTDGAMRFDIQPARGGAGKAVAIKVPVLGAYSKIFPLNCDKSKAIIKQAAAFYAGKDRMREHNLWNALACLFLLSTGDDAYVPRVKAYFAQFLNADGTVKKIGTHTWFNGYNGVACAEYYLRTGDKSVLPILQHYCDDARARQKFGVGWGHWDYAANPAYESGGGMQHSAGNQMLLTLMLGKMCGVKVDDKTLLGALKHWYRFAGRGTIPVSDTRPWFVFRSAGRDGGTAAVMHIASAARGDVSIYRQAKEYFALSNITSWPETHYNFEIYWHSLADHFMLEYDPARYYATMQHQRWRYDLGRQPSGAFWAEPENGSTDPITAGISLALAFTGPLKTLQITGAPRSKYAQDFTLPEYLWGNEADRVFLSSKHNPDFYKHGKEEDIDDTFRQLPLRLRYTPGEVKDLPLEMMLRDVRHARCEVRMAAAKALCMNNRFAEIEALLRDPDPRLRRAALDGINDYHAWFFGPPPGKYALKADAYTPAMVEAITAMLGNTNEAWYVVDGALTALHHAPVEAIERNNPRILPWTTHEEWWLRESAFLALMGLRDNEKLFVQHLPTLIDVMVKEYRFNPRYKMKKLLQDALTKWTSDSQAGKLIVAGFQRAAVEGQVLSDLGQYRRSEEGMVSVVEIVLASIKAAPEAAADLAQALATSGRVESMDSRNLMRIVERVDKDDEYRVVGFYPALETLSAPQKARLADTLFNVFRPELIKRFATLKQDDEDEVLDLLADLARLKNPNAGWQVIGAPKPEARVYRCYSFDPLTDKDRLAPEIMPPKRWRAVALPAGMEKWYLPEFDDSQWQSGGAPIGVGVFKAYRFGHMAWTPTPDRVFENKSDWGKGEFLLARTTFDVADLDYDYYRIRILADQGYDIYLNGRKLHSFAKFENVPNYRKIILTGSVKKQLKKGRNTLAVFCNARYEKDKKKESYHRIGQLDVYLEGLKKKDVGLGQ